VPKLVDAKYDFGHLQSLKQHLTGKV